MPQRGEFPDPPKFPDEDVPALTLPRVQFFTTRPFEPEVADSTPDEPIDTTPWKATRNARNDFTVAVGTVYGEDGSSASPAAEYDIATDTEDTKVWVACTVTAGTLIVTAVDWGSGATVPDDTPTLVHRKIVEFPNQDGSDPAPDSYLIINQIEDNDIYLSTSGAFSHMWKGTLVGETEPVGSDPICPIFNVKGGIVVVQGTRVPIADVAALEATSEEGVVVLAVVREESSRAYDAGNPPEILWFSSVPTSDYATEYTVLFEYTESEGINQCRHGEICSQESLFFENGEFKLLPFQANSRNTYDLPP